MASPSLPTTMRAAQWTTASGGLEKNLKLNSSAALPATAKNLPQNSVLVKVAYSTLNPVDYKVPEIPIVSSLAFSKPAVPSLDFSGTVASSARSDLAAGDRVFGCLKPPAFGALAEYVVVTLKEGCVKLPENVSLEHAPALGVCGLTAYQCIAPFVKEGQGSKVLINGGSGGTGTVGIQIAKALGCYVTATCSGPNVELCRSLGADEVIDYRANDVVEALKRSGRQYDLIVDNVGNAGSYAIYWNAQHYMKSEATFVTVAGSASLSLVWNVLQVYLLPAALGGGKRKFKFLAMVHKAEDLTRLGNWMGEGKIKTIVEKVYDLGDAGEAFARLKSGRTRGKLVVKVAGQ